MEGTADDGERLIIVNHLHNRDQQLSGGAEDFVADIVKFFDGHCVAFGQKESFSELADFLVEQDEDALVIANHLAIFTGPTAEFN